MEPTPLTAIPETVPAVDVRLLSISAREFFVYTLVDGRSDVRQLVARSGLGRDDLVRSLRILAGAGAVRIPGFDPGPDESLALLTSAAAARPVPGGEPLVRLLARIHRAGGSGTVVVERGRAAMRITLVRGEIVDVSAAFTGEFFGTYLLERGKITMGELQLSLQRMYAEKRRQGEVLSEMGLVGADELPGLLAGHAAERVADAIGWEAAEARYLEGETVVGRPLAIATSQVLFRAILARAPASVLGAELDPHASERVVPRVAAADLDAARLGVTEGRVWAAFHEPGARLGAAFEGEGIHAERARRFALAVLALGYVDLERDRPADPGEASPPTEPELARVAAEASAALAHTPARVAAEARPVAVPELLVHGVAVPDSGDLARIPAVAVLEAFLSSPRSGRLVFERGKAQKIVDLGGRGAIGTVLSVNADPPFGNYLLERGVIGFDVYERTLQRMYSERRRHGEVLVDEGALTPADLARHLREHLEHRLVELFGWSEGHYAFTEMAVATREEHVDPARLLFLGARSSLGDGWIATEIARVHQDSAVAARAAEVANLGLDAEDQALWRSLADGGRPVRELLDEAGEAANERARLLVALAYAGAIEFRSRAGAPDARSPRAAAPAHEPPAAPAVDPARREPLPESPTDQVLLRREPRSHIRTIHIRPTARSTPSAGEARQGYRRPRLSALSGFGEKAEFEDKIDGGAWEGDVDVEFVRENLSKTLKWMSHQHRFKILDAHESLTTEELEERYQNRREGFDPDNRRYKPMPEDIRNLAREICQVIDEAWQFLRDEPRRIEYRRGIFGESNLALEADVQFKKGDVLLFWKREPEGAIPLYMSAIDLYPKNPDYHAALGLAVYRANRKRLGEALGHIERGIRLRGESELPYMYLGMIYRDEGARQKAADAFKKALQVNPRSKDARALLERLLRGASGDPSDDSGAQ